MSRFSFITWVSSKDICEFNFMCEMHRGFLWANKFMFYFFKTQLIAHGLTSAPNHIKPWAIVF